MYLPTYRDLACTFSGSELRQGLIDPSGSHRRSSRLAYIFYLRLSHIPEASKCQLYARMLMSQQLRQSIYLLVDSWTDLFPRTND
jgi:hypothetical protein